jgi:hypothetical protein
VASQLMSVNFLNWFWISWHQLNVITICRDFRVTYSIQFTDVECPHWKRSCRTVRDRDNWRFRAWKLRRRFLVRSSPDVNITSFLWLIPNSLRQGNQKRVMTFWPVNGVPGGERRSGVEKKIHFLKSDWNLWSWS